MFLHLTLFSAMFDSIPLLSLADEAETEVTSRSSERHVATHASDNNAAHAQKLERLEKEMTATGARDTGTAETARDSPAGGTQPTRGRGIPGLVARLSRTSRLAFLD